MCYSGIQPAHLRAGTTARGTRTPRFFKLLEKELQGEIMRIKEMFKLFTKYGAVYRMT